MALSFPPPPAPPALSSSALWERLGEVLLVPACLEWVHLLLLVSLDGDPHRACLPSKVPAPCPAVPHLRTAGGRQGRPLHRLGGALRYFPWSTLGWRLETSDLRTKPCCPTHLCKQNADTSFRRSILGYISQSGFEVGRAIMFGPVYFDYVHTHEHT